MLKLTPPPYQGDFSNPTWQQWFWSIFTSVKELQTASFTKATVASVGEKGTNANRSGGSLNTTTYYWANF